MSNLFSYKERYRIEDSTRHWLNYHFGVSAIPIVNKDDCPLTAAIQKATKNKTVRVGTSTVFNYPKKGDAISLPPRVRQFVRLFDLGFFQKYVKS